MKKRMFLSKNWYFSVQKALIYYTVNKSHHNSFIMSTPLGGGYIIFAFFAVRCPMSGVRCPASRMVSAHLKEKY